MTVIPKTRYDMVSMLIHWVTAILMIVMIFFGEDLMGAGGHRESAAGAVTSTFGPSIHVSIGITILVLTLLRLIWRVGNPAPANPPSMKRYEIIGSKAIQGLFYLLMIGLPLTGWLAFGGLLAEEPGMAAVRAFGAFPLPAAPNLGETPGDIHSLGSNVAMALLGLHVLAALKHQFIDRDGIMARILPY